MDYNIGVSKHGEKRFKNRVINSGVDFQGNTKEFLKKAIENGLKIEKPDGRFYYVYKNREFVFEKNNHPDGRTDFVLVTVLYATLVDEGNYKRNMRFGRNDLKM